ncbi:MAG: methyltransferase domain-containing protein [Xanthobacteraceae bacterium]
MDFVGSRSPIVEDCMSLSEPMRVNAWRLQWTRELAEQYWRGTYDADLEAARLTSKSAELITRALAVHLERGAHVAQLLARDNSFDAPLANAGYRSIRMDSGSIKLRSDRSSTTHSTEERVDAVLSVEALCQLANDEIDGYFSCVRLMLKEGGIVVVTVPNNETLDQYLALDPQTAALFHIRQHLRSFTADTIDELLTRQGFKVEVLQTLELTDAAFASCVGLESVLKAKPRLHLGSGAALFVIGRFLTRARGLPRAFGGLAACIAPVLPRRGGLRWRVRAASARSRSVGHDDLARSHKWAAQFAKAALHASERPPLRQVQWLQPVVDRFWSSIAGTPMDEMSFGRVNGRHLLQVLLPWLKVEKQYLDYGAGDGSLVEYMLEQGFSVAAWEPAAARREMLQARLAHHRHYLGALTDLPQARFEGIFAIEVIEHVPRDNVAEFLGAMGAGLVPGGTLIISTPHEEDLAASMVYSPLSGAVFHRWQHLQSWTAARLCTTLESCGFTCEKVYDVDFSARPVRLTVLAKPLAPAKVEKVGNTTLLVIARKAEAVASC